MSARQPRASTARECPVCKSDMTGKPNRVQTCSPKCAGSLRRVRSARAVVQAVWDKWDTGKTWEATAAAWGWPSLAAFERAAYRAGMTDAANLIRRERYRLERDQ